MVALPLLAAPFRALVGHRSDTHRSALGWRRVPYLWFGSLLQFGGLAIMPFALILLQPGADTQPGGAAVGHVAAALAFLMVGAGMQTTQTAGLALATDQARPDTRPRVVALMYVMLLLGMVMASMVFSLVLQNFTATRLVGVVQGAAIITMLLNTIALWKQEARGSIRRDPDAALQEPFRQVWRRFSARPQTRRFLVAVALGTAAFNMQDIVLEPYGGAILKLSVASTSLLTAGLALGSFTACHRRAAAAARLRPLSTRGHRPADRHLRVLGRHLRSAAGLGLAVPLRQLPHRPGRRPVRRQHAGRRDGAGEPGGCAGLALGAWGAMQAGAGGIAVALGGTLRDGFEALAAQGWLGTAMSEPQVAYSVVYHPEIALLFGTLIALGPLVRPSGANRSSRQPFGLAEFPG